MNILKRMYFYFHPLPFNRKCLVCGKRIKRGDVESLFHPITNEWIGVKRAIHWECYVKVHNYWWLKRSGAMSKQLEIKSCNPCKHCYKAGFKGVCCFPDYSINMGHAAEAIKKYGNERTVYLDTIPSWCFLPDYYIAECAYCNKRLEGVDDTTERYYCSTECIQKAVAEGSEAGNVF